jgi:hypothetical protein
MVMGFSLLNNVLSKCTLGQQSIGSDCFALDIDAVEEGDGNFYFVCLLFFFAPFYGQGSDFFWV